MFRPEVSICEKFGLFQFPRGGRWEDVLPETLGGGVRPASDTLALFQTKTCDFPYPYNLHFTLSVFTRLECVRLERNNYSNGVGILMCMLNSINYSERKPLKNYCIYFEINERHSKER